MGSLMAGWDSLNLDPKIERNKSFTKEEIENFWQLHKPSQHQQQHGETETAETRTSFDVPHFVFQEGKCLIDLDKAYKSNDWWTRSNCAFLNEPPREEELLKSTSNYAAQFHVASAKNTTQAT